ncbi:MAG: phosphatidate cytidylyltransferase [Dissulfurispiraceae bacterium]|jgi:phosphatidate cytidylyltransferase|nr:phosphatidate cytidylyltransferase [Dissulfurispiraceae bacterium]
MHLKRIIAAIIALPLAYFYISALPPVFFFALITAVSCLGQFEFHSMYKADRKLSAAAIILSTLFMMLFYVSTSPRSLLPGIAVASILFAIFPVSIITMRLFYRKGPEGALSDAAPVITAFVYIPLLLLPQWAIMLKGWQWIILLYSTVWAGDSAAFYIGTYFGKRKLCPAVSPNKTVEGAFGSVAGGIFGALLIGSLLLNEMGAGQLIIIGAVIGAVTIFGDLVESMFKRDAGVKDSGSIIPGHGGMLDKIDGSLFAGPALYILLMVL